MQRSDWYLNHPCQFLLSVISLGLCSVILQNLTILISFSLMPISPPLGKHSSRVALGGLKGTRVPTTEEERMEFPSRMRGGVSHKLVRRHVSGPFCCWPLLMNFQATSRSESQVIQNFQPVRALRSILSRPSKFTSIASTVSSYQVAIQVHPFPLEERAFHLFEESFMRNFKCYFN